MIDGIEKTSLTWRTLMDWIDADIDEMRDLNENAQLTAEETLAIRARIATLREIQTLTDPKRQLAPEAVAFDAR